ncbi:MAG TPA: LLM class flavin-dependent oxidoreductase [Chloroflexota bacterium]|nr:LLM class flavin-dependent oxidoreductase [Chloroflexota bacterium]
MRFGLFDWLDDTGRDVGETYQRRLEMVELADKAGFYCYHVAEHHQTPLSTLPSPNLFLAAASQRTTRIRLATLAYLLPFYQPLRLMEEIAMMDQLCQGRLEIGLSRGASQFEMASYGISLEESRPRFEEALDVILMGLSTGRIDYRGKYFRYDNVETRLQPVQRPYPPLWYPTSNVESIPWIAQQGFNTIFALHLAPNVESVWDMLARYRQELHAHKGDAKRLNGHVAQPNYGFSMHVHVAQTDEQALKEARASWQHFFENFSYLWVKHGMGDRYRNRSDFDQLMSEGKFLIGSPAKVRDQLKRYSKVANANYFLGSFSWGSFTPEQILSSVDLFAQEVMPALQTAAAPAHS